MAALLSIAIGLVAGISLSAMGGGGLPPWLGATTGMALGTVLALIARRTSARPRPWLVVGLGVVAALAGSASIGPPAAEEDAPIGAARIEGSVVELRAGRDRTDAIVRIESATPIGEGSRAPPVGARVRIRERALPEGAEIAGTIALAPVPGFRNPSPHPPWPVVDPLRADARAIAIDVVGARSWIAYAIGAIRAHVRAALLATLDEPTCGVARALVLGDLALDDDSSDAVRAAGLSHVLAVSGMHVTLLIGALVWLVRRGLAAIPAIAQRWEVARIAAAIGVPLAIVYAPFAGGSPSAWRAALTAAIAWSLRAIGRRSDPVAVTAAAVIVFAVVEPADVVRPAFLLSIAATAAILAPIEETEERPLRALVIASVRASLATSPIVIWCFEGVPIAGVVANVVIVPIASAVLLPIAAVHAVIASIAPGIAGPTGALLDGIARGFLAGCETFAAIPWGRSLPPLDVVEGVLVSALAVALLLARSWRARAIAVVIGIAALGGAEWRLRAVERPLGVVRALFLDVGQGDGALIDMPDGSLIVIDAGGVVGAGIDPGAAAMVPLLHARRRERIDVAVITHPHPDHYGGMRALIESVAIGEIWDTGQGDDEAPDGELAQLLEVARARGIVIRRPAEICARPRAFGAATVRVIWPCPSFDPGWDPNDNSLVIEVRLGERTLLFTGDVEEHAEGALAASGLLSPVDVLKVGHHGSRTSSTPAFLRALEPSIAVVSAGRGNRFGHPHADVVTRLDALTGEVVRIDREGGAMIWTDGRRLTLETWSGRAVTLVE